MPSTSQNNRKLKYCTNCESSLEQDERFCPSCGQKNLDRKVSFWVFIKDFVHEEFNLNNRLFISLKELVIKPGALTVSFMEGKRRSYLRPSQMFLVTGFLCFFVLSFQIDKEVDKLDKGSMQFMDTDIFDSKGPDSTENSVFVSYIKSHIQEANDNPKNFIANTFQKLPFILLFVLPIFALFHKLIYIRHRVYFVEHLVFLLHVHAFMFLLIFIAGIFTFFFSQEILFYIPLAMLLYLFVAFRRVYEQGFWKTLVKFSILFWVYVILVPTLWVSLAVFIGLLA